MNLKFEFGPQDMLAYLAEQPPRRSCAIQAVAILAYLAMIGTAVYAVAWEGSMTPNGMFWACMGAVFAMAILYIVYKLLAWPFNAIVNSTEQKIMRLRRRLPTLWGPREVILTDEGIRHILPDVESLYRWACFERIQKTITHIILYTRLHGAIIIPRQQLPKTDVDAFVEMFEARSGIEAP